MKAFLLVGLICINGISAITFENNGYKDVIVSIHPDVPEKDGQTIIDNIKVRQKIPFLCFMPREFSFRTLLAKVVMNCITPPKATLT